MIGRDYDYWRQFTFGGDPATVNGRVRKFLTDLKEAWPEAETRTYPGAGVIFVHIWVSITRDVEADEMALFSMIQARADYEGPVLSNYQGGYHHSV